MQGTDQTMLAKLHKTHGSHRNYLKPKSDINTSFGLNHFAGVVFYDTRGNLYCIVLFFLSTFETKIKNSNTINTLTQLEGEKEKNKQFIVNA